MALHPLARQFASVAEAYERGRPDYAPAVVGAIAAELGLAPGDPVLDLGAGTGKLSRALLAAGLDVIGVEPLETLREVLAERLGVERALAGLAEEIPRGDGSAAAVTVADAFHWFDQPAALAEIRRVLRPGGGLALLSSVPDWRGASWAHELGSLIAGARPAHPHFDGPPWQQAVSAAGGWTALREIRVTSSQPAQPERMVDYLCSLSWVAAMPDERRAELLAQADALVRAGSTPAELKVHVVVGLASLA
ncbi:MAG TPA: class I SAM-dependent methyltransferase [Solirubrobacteraceae bacterium]|nr:class I SAM-dependent methyltransferase [Solirubrobacteraceae bacterium]